MSIFWKRRRHVEEEALEAKAAKIDADIQLSAANQTRRDVEQQTNKLRRINAENHFSEALHKSFRGGRTA